MTARTTIKTYYQLTKPGIIRGNLLAVAAGYLFAGYQGTLEVLIYTLASTALVIASSCVFNNFIDRDIDLQMQRTRRRGFASGAVRPVPGLLYGSLLGVLGFALLATMVNTLTFMVGLVAFVLYVIVYAYGKRWSAHGTLIGAVPGALPPVAGYTAASGTLDTTAWFLFAILVIWQMPHFYAIAMLRIRDYKSARLPVMPAVYGTDVTKQYIMLYTVLFLICGQLLFIHADAAVLAAVMTGSASLLWILVGLRNYQRTSSTVWARQMFGMSLLCLLVLCGSLSLDGLLA